MEKTIETIESKINNKNKDFIIFGLSYCEFCRESIKLLKKNKTNFKYYLIDNHFNEFFLALNQIEKLNPNLKIKKEHKTVPVIFYKKNFLGGYTELLKFFTPLKI